MRRQSRSLLATTAWAMLTIVVTFLLLCVWVLVVDSCAHAQELVYHEAHASFYRPTMDFWALSDKFARPNCWTIRVNLLLDDGYCLRVRGAASFSAKLRNRRSGETIVVQDRGIMVREANTIGGWRDTLFGDEAVVHWSDDGDMKRNARDHGWQGPLPVRILMYLPDRDLPGGGKSWDILDVWPLANRTEVERCGN